MAKYYKCMIVKRIEDNKPVTDHKLSKMYEDEAQKFLRSAKNLEEAKARAKEHKEPWINNGCVIAEVKTSQGQRRFNILKRGRPYVSRKPYKEGTTIWLVYIAPDGTEYEIDGERKLKTRD